MFSFKEEEERERQMNKQTTTKKIHQPAIYIRSKKAQTPVHKICQVFLLPEREK